MDIEILRIIIEGIVAIVVAIAAKVFVPYVQELRQNKAIDAAVKAAEKIFKDSGAGVQKKEYVVKFLIEKKIVKLDNEGNLPIEIDILIEAAVKELDKLTVKSEG